MMTPRPQPYIPFDATPAEPEAPRRFYCELDWRVWSLGVMLDLSPDWQWCGIKLGPVGLGIQWRP